MEKPGGRSQKKQTVNLSMSILTALAMFALTVLGIFWAQRAMTFRWHPPGQGRYERTVRVAAIDDFSPYSYLDENGNQAGFDVELAYAIGEIMGVNIEIQLGQWDEIKKQVERGECDLLMGVTLSDERQETLTLSHAVIQDSYETFGYGLGNRVANLERSNIAVLRGGYESEHRILKNFVYGVTEENIISFDSYAEEIASVAAGECAYAVVPERYGVRYIRDHHLNGIRPQGLSVYMSSFCIGTAKGNTALIDEVNTAIIQLNDEGTLNKISEHWYENNISDFTFSYFLKENRTTILVFLLLCLSVGLIAITVKQWRIAVNADAKVQSQAKTLQEIGDDMRRLSQERDRIMYHDVLTDCLNFDGFKREVHRLLKEHPTWQYILSYSDFKGFKYINEHLGKEEGDKLLCFHAQFCRETAEEGEAFGRIADDRFVAFTRMTDDQNRRFEQGTEAIRNYFRNRGINYGLQYVVGIYSLTPDDYANPDVDRMVANARIAEMTLKESNLQSSWMMFNPEQFTTNRRRMMISAQLKAAIQEGQIQVYLQPQYNCVKQSITGAEALCRWQHPEFGWIPPAEFIPWLESTGQIYELDCFIWEEVCRLQKKWKQGDRHVPISVNVSRMDIEADNNIADHLLNLVRQYELTPDQLHIEITESTYMNNANLLIETLEKLRKAGFTVEMDDFGSGYSSLNMLKEVPVDVIKLDLRFLAETGDQKKGQNILSYVIRMAKSMGLGVITEGVETFLQEQLIRSLGCSSMQGFYFFRPMPVEQFEALMQSGDFRMDAAEQEIPERLDIRELMNKDSLSSYLFNYCIGAASVNAYDGKKLELVLANEKIFHNLRSDQAQATREADDILQLLDQTNRERLKAALNRAVEEGYSSCVVQADLSGDWLRATYRYLYTNSDQHILFSLQENLSEVQAALAAVKTELPPVSASTG